MRRALHPAIWVALLAASPSFAEGPERERAQTALFTAQNALLQVDGGAATEAARLKVEEARALFADHRYPEAAAAADAAWKALSTDAEVRATAFSVEVKGDGETKVTSKTGQAVHIEAQGVQRAIDPGKTVLIARGRPPEPEREREPEPLQAARAPDLSPIALLPADGALLKLRPDGQGNVGPVKLSWKGVPAAHGYEVEVLPSKPGAKTMVFTSAKNQVVIKSLPPGRYAWKVKAKAKLDDEGASEPSAARFFVLEATRIKLEVRGTEWK